jgi:glycosyltransferase involved in cell wall biosynthesis
MHKKRPRVAVLATHPIQYFVPLYRELASHIEIELLFAHRQDAAGQAKAGFGVEFDWDVPLLNGYRHRFLHNRARRPDVSRFFGCVTPEVTDLIRGHSYDAVVVHGWYSKSYMQAIQACWMGARAREYYLHYGANPEKMFFCPHCVDNQFFASRAKALRTKRSEIRAEWGIDESSLCFLFAGKLTSRKRPMDFVRALNSARPYHNVCGLVVGDGPLRGALEDFVRREKVPVHFAGFVNQSEMPKAYVAADVLVLPSDGSETWGLVVNEAMASGVPAVVSDAVGCGPDLVIMGRTGMSFPCGDTAQLAAIMRFLAAVPFELMRMSEASIDHVTNYSIERAATGIIEAVENVLAVS